MTKIKLGFSLLELMFTMILLALLLSMAVPQFKQQVAIENVKNAVSEVEALMLYAKSLATSQGKPLWIEMIPSDENNATANKMVPSEPASRVVTWQVILHQGEPLSGADDGILRTVSGGDYAGIVMASGIVSNRLLIEGQYGKIGNGHLRFYWREAPNQVIKVISSYGASRVRSCSVGEAAYGYPAC